MKLINKKIKPINRLQHIAATSHEQWASAFDAVSIFGVSRDTRQQFYSALYGALWRCVTVTWLRDCCTPCASSVFLTLR